jgi:hypothetical protein
MSKTDNGVVWALGAATTVAMLGVVRQRGSAAQYFSREGWHPTRYESKQEAEDYGVTNFLTEKAVYFDDRWAKFIGLDEVDLGAGWYVVDHQGRIIR